MNEQKPKRPLYKRWYTWLAGLLFLSIVGQVVDGLKPGNAEAPGQTAESSADEVYKGSGGPPQFDKAPSDDVLDTDGDGESAEEDGVAAEDADEPLVSDAVDPAEPEESLNEEPNEPPEEPAPIPEQPAGIEVVSSPGTVYPGQRATITVKGQPNTQYSITVMYKSGASSAQGLDTKTSDSTGRVSWTWLVGRNTSSGSFYALVSGGGQNVRIPFTVG